MLSKAKPYFKTFHFHLIHSANPPVFDPFAPSQTSGVLQ